MEALIIVDIQNDFLPGGSLAVPEGDKVIPVINELAGSFKLAVATQDWHPENHRSFAVNHPGKNTGDTVSLNGLEQALWPVHCVKGTEGAKLSPKLRRDKIHRVFQKGTDPYIDSYSGFFENGRKKSTGLHYFLKSWDVDTVVVVGLAADYCVKYTALDALKLGYRTFVVTDATKAVGGPASFKKTMEELKSKGAFIVNSKETLEMIKLENERRPERKQALESI